MSEVLRELVMTCEHEAELRGEERGRKIGEEHGRKIGEEHGRKIGEEHGKKLGEEIGRKLGEEHGKKLGALKAKVESVDAILKLGFDLDTALETIKLGREEYEEYKQNEN